MMHHWMTEGMQFTMYNVAQCNALMCIHTLQDAMYSTGWMHKVDDRRDGGWMLRRVQSYLS